VAIQQGQHLAFELLRLGVALAAFLGFLQDALHVLQLLMQLHLDFLQCGNHLPKITHAVLGHSLDEDTAQPVAAGQAAERGEVLQLHQLDLQEVLLITQIHFLFRDCSLRGAAQLQDKQVARDEVPVTQVNQAVLGFARCGDHLHADYAGQLAKDVRGRMLKIGDTAFNRGLVALHGFRRGCALLLDAAVQIVDAQARKERDESDLRHPLQYHHTPAATASPMNAAMAPRFSTVATSKPNGIISFCAFSVSAKHHRAVDIMASIGDYLIRTVLYDPYGQFARTAKEGCG
jgi:hypothetical protein